VWLVALLLSVACDSECRLDRECASNQICLNSGVCRQILPPPPPPHEDRTDGFDDVPGSGRVFVVDQFGLLPPNQGFDLDGRCLEEGNCIDNAFGLFAALLNDQFRQGMLGGETLVLVEIAGIDLPFTGDDANVTVKFYRGVDSDRPFFPANNFQIPQGETDCCKFLIHPSALHHNGAQARYRFRARIEDGKLHSTDRGTLRLPGILSDTSSTSVAEFELRHALVSLTFDSNFNRLSDGQVGGVLPISNLLAMPNPYCENTNSLCASGSASSSWLEILLGSFQPDVDMDGDGLEGVDLSRGRIVQCRDGCGGCARQPRVPPLDPSHPETCAFSAAMADGFSAAYFFGAIPATIVGVGDYPPEEPK
jgi:hypothetical protein